MKPPGSRRSLAGETLVCFVLSTAVVLLFETGRPLELGDEGYLYLLSRAWARGDPLFQRFQVLYPAGQYALVGTFMRVFGDGLAVLRLAGSLLTGAATALLYLAVRRSGAKRSLAGSMAAAVTLSGAKAATLFATAPVVIAGLHLARPGAPGRRFLFFVSASAGILAGFREDSAVLALLIALVAVSLRRRPWELVTVVAPAILIGFLPWWLVAVGRGEGTAFAAHTLHRLGFLVERLAFPGQVPRLPRLELPRSPTQVGILFAPGLSLVPLLFYAALLVTELANRKRREHRFEPRRLAAALIGLAYIPQLLWERPDFPHLRSHLPVFLAVAVVVAASAGDAVRKWTTALLTALAVTIVGGVVVQRQLVPPVPYPCCEGRRIGASLRGDVPPWAGLERRPGETLMSLPWSPGWYVLEGFEPGSRLLSAFPRHVDSPELRAEMAADMADPANRWVVVREAGWPPLPPEVTRTLTTHYRQAGRWRAFRLWERRPVPLTGPPAASASAAASWSPP